LVNQSIRQPQTTNCEQATQEKMRIAEASCQQQNTMTNMDESNSSVQLELSKDMIDAAVVNLFL
jgi:hypothetical protein